MWNEHYSATKQNYQQQHLLLVVLVVVAVVASPLDHYWCASHPVAVEETRNGLVPANCVAKTIVLSFPGGSEQPLDPFRCCLGVGVAQERRRRIDLVASEMVAAKHAREGCWTWFRRCQRSRDWWYQWRVFAGGFLIGEATTEKSRYCKTRATAQQRNKKSRNNFSSLSKRE